MSAVADPRGRRSPPGPAESMAAPDDQAVVAAVLAGDRDAYRLLVERHQQRIFHALWRMTGDYADAEDLTQEVFLRAFVALASYKPDYRFSTWLRQIASNLAINHRQRQQRQVPVVGDAIDERGHVDQAIETAPDDDPAAQPEAAVEAHDTGEEIWQAVANLPDEFRQVLVMRHVLELSYDEICVATGLPMGTVKSRLLRARRHLAAHLARARG